ncbi:hypothetical protein L9F63_028144, partial [Diploptera punctata]
GMCFGLHPYCDLNLVRGISSHLSEYIWENVDSLMNMRIMIPIAGEIQQKI